MVKNWQKGSCKGLVKKTNCNHQSSISNKTKPKKQFQTFYEHNKWTPYFTGFVLCHMLVACCLMMVRCTVESTIRDYHKYISKISLESELDLLKYCNIDMLTLIIMQNKFKRSWMQLTLLCAPHVTKRKIGEKVSELLRFAKFIQVFPLQSFLIYDSMQVLCALSHLQIIF